MPIPNDPKIYHILNIDRLTSVISDRYLWCDAHIVANARPGTTIGMGAIKERRLRLPVKCWPSDHVGDYVPFYFCPRSIMLFVIHYANAPELAYKGGQDPIIHLEADLHSVITAADNAQRRWAISLSNAGAAYSEFRAGRNHLSEIDWAAVENRDFRSPTVKEGKQAEFLVKQSFPWRLVSRIGVRTSGMAQRVADALRMAEHRPEVRIMPSWYF